MFADAIKPDRERARSVLPASARVHGAMAGATRVGSLSFQTSARFAPVERSAGRHPVGVRLEMPRRPKGAPARRARHNPEALSRRTPVASGAG